MQTLFSQVSGIRILFLTVFTVLLFFSLNGQQEHSRQVNPSWSMQQQIDSLCSWSWQARTSDGKLSYDYATLALSIAQASSDNQRICNALFHQGSALYNSGKPLFALKVYQNAMQLIDAQTDFILSSRIYNGIGLAYVDLARYDEAILYYNKARDVYVAHQDNEGIALQLQNIGVVYYMVGRTDDALKNYLRSVSILENLDDVNPSILANNYLNTAIVFMQIGEKNKALGFFRKAEQIYTGDYNLPGLAHLYTNMGVLYFDNDLDSSLYFHNRSLELYQTLGKSMNAGHSMGYVADIYREMGEFDKALDYYLLSMSILENEGFVYGQVTVLTGLGTLYRMMNDFHQSVRVLKRALVLAVEIEAVNLQIHAAHSLSQSFALKGDYKSAYEYSELHRELSDSLLNQEKLRIIKSLEFSYESEKKQREIEKLKAHGRMIRMRLFLIITVSSVILVSLAIFINRQRMIRKKEKMFAQTQKQLQEAKLHATESELLLRKKILLNYALRVTEKNNLLSDISGRLRELKVPDSKELAAIISSIRMNLLLPGERQELEQLTEQAGAEFFSKLQNISSDLTETEKRVCVFLSFGFSSKDISGIMNISSKTVDNYRSSVRKKLMIPDEESLSVFLQKM
jgi:tetratricopeptide (TPR) repeat protein